MATKAAYIILFLLIAAVILNSVFINRSVETIYSISSEGDDGSIEALGEKLEKIKDKYNKCELYISLSVSHDDLTDIETSLSEMEGAVKAHDIQAAIIAKSRFENALLHLARLSSFNFESIL